MKYRRRIKFIFKLRVSSTLRFVVKPHRWKCRGRPKKIWIYCVRQDMKEKGKEKGVNNEMTDVIGENGRGRLTATTPSDLGNGQEEEDIDLNKNQ
ncbi:unnamed protein product, partial [Brenthis ino]